MIGRFVMCAVAAGLTLTITAGSAGAEALHPWPDPDPFYSAPANLAAAQPGHVLAVRPMPPLPMFPTSTVTLVKFRSTNSAGKPIAATTTVLTPQNHRPNGPLLSYQHIINGLGAQCTVSHELYATDPNLVIREAPALNMVLLQGWSVALPDHLGPTSAYGAARLGGQITLDGIRAARGIPQLGVTRSPVAMAGYSGGGMATAWAAALAPRYAPELPLVGAAAGGVPANLISMVQTLGWAPHPVFGLAMAAAIGLEREYPEMLPVSKQLNPAGLALARSMANECTNGILMRGAGHNAAEFAQSTSLLTDPRAYRVGADNSLELFPGVPTIPIYEWHAPTDALIPVDALVNTVRRYCAHGTRVQADLFPSPDHLTTAVLGLPTALAWITARFAGAPAPSNC